MNAMKYLLSLLIMVFIWPTCVQADLGKILEDIHVQDGGRIKPYNTFAQETLQLIYGKSEFASIGENASQKSRNATEIVFTWMLVPDHWMEIPLIQVRHSGLKEALGYTTDEMKAKPYFSPRELLNNNRLSLIVQELNNKRNAQEKLDPYFQAVQTLETKLTLFQMISAGGGLRIMPPKPETDTDRWLSVAELEGEASQKFQAISNAFATGIASSMKGSEIKEAEQKLREAVNDFKSFAKQTNPKLYGDDDKVHLEVHLKNFHPFMWAWILYLLSVLFGAASVSSQKSKYRKIVWGLLFAGMAFHTYGMALRIYLLGRPPVSNMYETVVWVPWGAVLFAMVLERLKPNNMIFLGASLVATLCLILSDMAPVVLDPSLHPLEPVLRDNFWLLVHVIIIVSSYAAFFLAFALGDLLLIYYLRGEEKYKRQIKDGVQGIYRSYQIGVVLLALGIITGGIWADYSWGRFWGWDPKETWALIALLGYLAILHGRLVGWLRDFGLAVTSVVAFSLVIMAWYGVNFVLGAGLHTYGFGAGGVEYVSGFVALHLLFVVYVVTVRQSRVSQGKA